MERFKRGLKGGADRTTDRRRSELAKIHVLASQAGLDRETYESVLLRIGNVTSSAALDGFGRQMVIGYLQRTLGQPDHGIAPHNRDGKPMLRKIEALLADGGKPWAYGDALAMRICQKARLTFCSDAELRKVIAALTYDAKRRHAREEAATHA